MQELIIKLQEDIKHQQRKRFANQVSRLESELSEVKGLFDMMKTLGCYVAGGFWTSVFTAKEINDVDIYFRDIKSLRAFVANLMGNLEDEYNRQEFPSHLDDLEHFDWYLPVHCVGYTDKSVIFKLKGGLTLQCIHTKFYQSAQEIFDTFDYTINMCAYDMKEDLLVMDDNFLTDLSARRLTVNPKTSFPIISQLRIDKYKQRGYSINRKEFLKLSCAVAALNLTSWEEAISQLAGMYGWCIDKVFDKEKPFSMLELIEQMDKLEYNDQAITPVSTGDYFIIMDYIEEHHPSSEQLPKVTYYKKVVPVSEGKFSSWYKNSFIYETGEVVSDKNRGVFLFKELQDAVNYSSGQVVIALQCKDKPKASLKSDGGNGKYSTKDELIVLGQVDEQGNLLKV